MRYEVYEVLKKPRGAWDALGKASGRFQKASGIFRGSSALDLPPSAPWGAGRTEGGGG